jgi:hypothetical protein
MNARRREWNASRQRWCYALACSIALFAAQSAAADAFDLGLESPKSGDHELRILNPNLLELVRVNSKQPYPARVDSWDWVTDEGAFVPPNMSSVKVIFNGQTNTVSATGFKRRPIYAPLEAWDLQIGNHLYLRLSTPVSDGQSVQVVNNGTLWPTNMEFMAVVDPLRYSPAIHVNQEGYLPSLPKKAIVGYYLGNLGEMPIHTNRFSIVNAQSGDAVYEGTLTLRPDVGYSYMPTPYQSVYEADFSGFTTPGEYRVLVPGMGASLPFRIDEGVAMAFARTYALGLFHQRSAYNVAMPFTRFTHAADHTAPSAVPTNASAPFTFTWQKIADYAVQVNPDNPPQTAPRLTNSSAQLFPFVNPGPLNNSGGHFEAGDYNRVTFNGAQLVHSLMFAADSLPGAGNLDNLGIPESGDGISDLLQEAKWEADFLAKMQDSDGGFYYSRYPRDREYENDVLPENGDPEVVWPKNTMVTAAAVAALAQCASSPRFKQAYPQTASNYWAKAQLGWKFLTNAIALHGLDGAYQRIQHFGDFCTDRDDLAWVACEMYLATADVQYQNKLFAWYPDPTDLTTFKWGWWRMFESYGNAARDYAFAVSSGRLAPGQINQTYRAKCVAVITNCGNDNLQWSQDHAYGSSFPDVVKIYRGGGWYFSTVQAFDIVVAHQLNPRPEYLDAILLNLNYEGGCNPVNVTFATGLGWKRQRSIVDQYSVNDRRAMPKDGMPVGNIQERFFNTWTYGAELSVLMYPFDHAETNMYPFYDRWCDDWNVSTESSSTDIARSLAVSAWLAAQTSLGVQPWRFTNATIVTPPGPRLPNQPVTVTLQVANPNLMGTRIVWEARDEEPSFGGLNYTFTPGPNYGDYWIEAEVQWPDGRRAFATNSVIVDPEAPSQLSNPQPLSGGGFSFQLAGTPDVTYLIQVSTNLAVWQAISTNTLPPAGVSQVIDAQANGFSRRYYRAVRPP